MQIVVLTNNDFTPDPNMDNPAQITYTAGPVTEALWDLINKKQGNPKKEDNPKDSNIRFVNSVILDVEVNNVPNGKPFKLNLFIRPQIPIVSVL